MNNNFKFRILFEIGCILATTLGTVDRVRYFDYQYRFFNLFFIFLTENNNR